MKKFTIKGVLDGFRSSVPQPVKPDQEIVENLRPEHFQVKKTFRHGFPHQPTAVAFDPIQRLLAIGTKSGSLRILGRPGVDAHVKHEGCTAVIQLQFLINEGALVSATADDTLHLWNFRQKIPQVVQSLKFQRERITCIHLPLQSKWLYVGTERGNIHVLHIETFVLSGYVINWNKAIEVSRKTHPGAVVHLSDNPLDLSKMLIGYESGQIVFWDLKTKNADYRCQSDVPLRSISWHHEGKQFMCSHTDGSLSTWTVRQLKPTNVTHPHAKTTKDGEPEPCKPIQKVEWKLSRSGEAYVIFSGGLAYDTTGRTPSITVIHGKTTTVLEMEHNVIDFITLCENPWTSDYQDPYAVVVLLQNDLVVIDLLTPGFPCFENPYPMDIHESPVTCCAYFADCPSDLVPAFYSVGSKSQKKTGFSEKDWPISGGEWSSSSSGYNEIILTGHADGSIKFWDASAGTLQVLYKLKTAKLFEKGRTRSLDSEEDPLAIQLIFLCPESRKLAIAGSGRHVVLFKFKKVESMSEVVTLDISLTAEPVKEVESSSDHDSPAGGNTSGSSESKNNESSQSLKIKTGLQKRAAGFQATLVCLTVTNSGEQAENITALSLNSSYGLMAYGNECGIVIIDIVQKISLIVLNTGDIGGNVDLCQRVLRSPKRQDELKRDNEDKARSPSTDQTRGDTGAESEGLLGMVADRDGQHSQKCPPPRGSEYQTGSNNDKGTAEESVIEMNKSAVNEEESCAKNHHGWKGFNLKRQLSKVDLKIKSTFSPALLTSQNGVGSDTSSQKSCVFYCNVNENASSLSPVESIVSESSLSPEDSLSERGESPTGEDTGKRKSREEGARMRAVVAIDAAQADRNRWIGRGEREAPPADGGGGGGGGGGVARPVNLTLAECQESRPPILKKIVKMRQAKREGRLLSVPNLKFAKNDPTMICDLRCEETNTAPESFTYNLIRRFSRVDKYDSSFQRSRSSSMSSLENITTETISCLTFADSYTKKSDTSPVPTLWIGTSLGSIQTVIFNTPPRGERHAHPVVVSTCNGSTFKLKGCILSMSFLDCNGALIPYSYESWKDDSMESKERNRSQGKCANSRMSPSMNTQAGTGDGFEDRQFVVLASEKQARVVALPSQNCLYRQQLAETHIVIKAEITTLKDNVCLVCYVSNGHIATYSLPSLRLLIDVDFLPLIDLRIAKTLCFSNRGHGLYLSSPTEIQKFSVSSQFCGELTEMMGDLFIGHDMPEPPKESFFKGLFGGGSRSLDREELFGESSGRASRTVAKHIPGPNAGAESLRERVTTATGEVNLAHQMVLERGEKLSQLEDRTARMMSEAESFSQSAHGLMLKYKDKKWYQL
ncbi:syntaxin-binding protein 5 isoform X3 [Apis mellifera]|uniref:Syntaxin-binding protein 5-like n=1 Tax=Apis mellifera TaxID=7460 RepID=A0A7M7GYV9_APIME|nr:syntaxin-binding protein 5 isoform X3 [Apis mellifera]|eukprot:XP_006569742.2 syntaxin-binding protein 5 isoform X3 [Apis mellifera]